MQDSICRFVKDLASTDNIRAKQVMRSNLKPTEHRVISFVKEHMLVVQKLNWCRGKLTQSKQLMQVRAEAPEFLKAIKAECKKADTAALVEMFRILEEFQ